MQNPNFFTAPALDPEREEFLTLLDTQSVRIERIASHGQGSAENFWYDQADDEWVMLVRGSAVLEFETRGSLELGAGDSIRIPRHERHRVARASADALWLAVHVAAR